MIGGSGFPIPSQSYVDNVVNNFVTPNFPSFTVSNAISLFTPLSRIGLPASRP
ncbi:hypothetical protein I551_3865 [Mycobacterium ulcerans str. Harvey]|uniref:Uncharacterized protein n=1 Tax=Mycobacterium ulcerans str. Harvey TaxID=1299332 RepID=A0ABN0QYH4_MYCUL|nr:hypothetical protein I551_3865 [Mycobacterium ulcerans str. Harvey]